MRLESCETIEDWGKTARRNRALLRIRARFPRHIYRREGKYNPPTLANRFGGWSSVPRAFRNFAKGKREWADVLALVPAPVARSPLAKHARSRINEDSVSSIPPKQYNMRR